MAGGRVEQHERESCRGALRCVAPRRIASLPRPSLPFPSLLGSLFLCFCCLVLCMGGQPWSRVHKHLRQVGGRFDFRSFVLRLFSFFLVRLTMRFDRRRRRRRWVHVRLSCLVSSISQVQVRHNLRRRLIETEVPYVVTVPGNTYQGLIQSINHFENNYAEVSGTMGVREDEVGGCD